MSVGDESESWMRLVIRSMSWYSPNRRGLAYYGNLTTLISLTVSFFLRWLPCKNTQRCFFPNSFYVYEFLSIVFFYFESRLKINFEVKNFESATMQFYEWIKNKICEWLLFGFSYLNILFFVSDLSFFVNFVTVLFLPDKRYMYLILWLIWRRVWYHILRVYFLHSLFQLYLINTFPIKKKIFFLNMKLTESVWYRRICNLHQIVTRNQ